MRIPHACLVPHTCLVLPCMLTLVRAIHVFRPRPKPALKSADDAIGTALPVGIPVVGSGTSWSFMHDERWLVYPAEVCKALEEVGLSPLTSHLCPRCPVTGCGTLAASSHPSPSTHTHSVNSSVFLFPNCGPFYTYRTGVCRRAARVCLQGHCWRVLRHLRQLPEQGQPALADLVSPARPRHQRSAGR